MREYPYGLSEQEVMLRSEQGLINVPPKKNTKTTGEIIRSNVLTTFNAFNLAIGIFLAWVGAYPNMSYLLIIIVNVVIGIYQELNAKKMVENLSLIGAAKTAVIRSGEVKDIPVDELVLDDVTLLEMGTHICADSVVESGEIEVNESLLTGEADPVLKKPGDELLSGSFVISGRCFAKVIHVGAQNYASKLAEEAQKHKGEKSELLSAMRKVTRFTGFFIIPIGILLFAEALFFRSTPVEDAVISTAAALLGMLPKGLVLLISTSLAVGIVKLSRKKVLVQDLYAIEDLAHVDVLCLDKTGTITEGRMQVSNIYSVNENPLPISIEKAMGFFVGAMEDNNSTFAALKEHFSMELGIKPIHKTPFSSERKWSSASFDGIGTLVLGAPEIMVYQSETVLPPETLTAQESGKRILCLGFTEKIRTDETPVVKLAAVIELSDPVRKNAKETLAFFKQEGVEIKIISGDNPVTVSSIAKQAGLKDYDSYIDLSTLQTEKEVKKAASEYCVFGRVSPGRKRLLIQALQAKGHKVAMTGDGVNDVLALKEADCSIAMASGSDATKQVSKLVLVNSDFTTLPDIVMEGRRVVNNITRFGGVFFVKTIFSILLSLYSLIILAEFPFIPIQITLYDMILEGYPSFILSFEPNKERIQSAFLPTVFRLALPSAVLVLLNTAVMAWIASAVGISHSQANTVIFYITGFAAVLAVYKACQPFNKLRIFIFISSAVGFFTATWLFADILDLERLAGQSTVIICCLAALCVPIKFLFSFILDKQLKRKIVKP